MKKLKHLFMTLLATLAMVFSTVAASAQTVDSQAGGTGTITVTNAAQSQKYELYKLFDATVTPDGKGISYKLPSGKTKDNFGGSTWFDVDSKGNITAKADIDVASDAFTAWAKGFGTKVTETTATEKTLEFTNLTFGYYFITSGLGAVLTIDSTTPNATVIDKNDQTPKIPDTNNGGGKKIVGANGLTSETTAKIGDTVPFQVKFTATNFVTKNKTTEQIKSYTVTDTPTALSINQGSVVVTVGTQTLTKDKDYTVNFDAAGKMTIVLNWVGANSATIYASPSDIVITYDAVVTKEAKEGEATNTATIGYKSFDPNDPNDPNHPNNPNPNPNTPDTPVDPKGGENQTKVTTHRFTLNKTSKADGSDTLTGAEFHLYDAKENGNEIKVVEESEGVYRVAEATETGVVIKAGKVVIKGLKGDTAYYLEETKAPNGYNILEGRQEVTVKKDNSTVSNVVNKSGAELPSTGSFGTTMFYLAGSAMLIGALVYMISKRRMENL